MITANEEILNRMVRHQTYLIRYAGGLRNKVFDLLTPTELAVKDIVMRFAEELTGVSITSKTAAQMLRAMQIAITEARMEAWDEISDIVLDEMTDLAGIEQVAALRMITDPLPMYIGLQPLSTSHLTSIAMATPFEGRTLKEWLKRNQTIDADRLTQMAKIGIMNGETPQQVARRVVGTPALKHKDGASRKAVRDMESVMLTVASGISNQVRQQFYEANDDIIGLELFVATLDMRTTLICASNDGKTFKLGKGPIPPLHFRCRSLRVPYINPDNLFKRGFDASYEKKLVMEFAKDNNLGKVTKVEDLPRGYKTAYNKWSRKRVRELVGQVPAQTTFEQWFRKQSEDFQDEYLGKTKANIFRQGKLSLDKFVTRDGYELTIDELRKLAS